MSDLNKKHDKIKNLIINYSPFDKNKTNKILNEWFNHVLTLVRIVINDYQFNNKKVLDLGCSYGNSILYWRDDSEGVEIQEDPVFFLNALGKKVYQLNVEEDLSQLEGKKYDAIYCAALIEHLKSPYSFLLQLNPLLKNDGVLAIAHPIVPPPFFRYLWKLAVGYQGWMAKDHLYFFTPNTSKLILERAGFKVIRQYSPAFYRIPILRKVNKIFLPIGMSCLSICKKK
jgi:2-polyprenyl-3-methyl-5-hydroxy-6-metoxy-1,4-benzoquinol methylase